MAKYGFLSVLEEEMDKNFQYDYAINWDKKNHAVELSFILEVGLAPSLTADDEIDEGIILEEFVLFYQDGKSQFQEEDYLVTIPFQAKKGFSRAFLAYFAQFLNQVADEGIDGIFDFLADESAEEFTMVWDDEQFIKGKELLDEGDYFPYPRY